MEKEEKIENAKKLINEFCKIQKYARQANVLAYKFDLHSHLKKALNRYSWSHDKYLRDINCPAKYYDDDKGNKLRRLYLNIISNT